MGLIQNFEDKGFSEFQKLRFVDAWNNAPQSETAQIKYQEAYFAALRPWTIAGFLRWMFTPLRMASWSYHATSKASLAKKASSADEFVVTCFQTTAALNGGLLFFPVIFFAMLLLNMLWRVTESEVLYWASLAMFFYGALIYIVGGVMAVRYLFRLLQSEKAQRRGQDG